MNRRLIDLITTLAGLSIEGLLMAAGTLWFLNYTHATQTWAYFELPLLLVVMGVIACLNIHEYLHPEMEEDESLQRVQ